MSVLCDSRPVIGLGSLSAHSKQPADCLQGHSGLSVFSYRLGEFHFGLFFTVSSYLDISEGVSVPDSLGRFHGFFWVGLSELGGVFFIGEFSVGNHGCSLLKEFSSSGHGVKAVSVSVGKDFDYVSIGGGTQKQGYSLVKVEDAPGVADSVADFGLRVSVFESACLKPHNASLLDKLACVKKYCLLVVVLIFPRAVLDPDVSDCATMSAGAEHTFDSGLPRSRESGFFISACVGKPGSVLAIQDPPGESGRPGYRQVFKYPALTCSEQAGQCPRTNFDSFLEDAMERYTGVSGSRLVKFPLAQGDCPACAGSHPAGHEWHCPVLSYLVSDFLAPGARLSIAQVGLVLDAVASFVAAMATDTPEGGADTAGGVDGDGVISEGVA